MVYWGAFRHLQSIVPQQRVPPPQYFEIPSFLALFQGSPFIFVHESLKAIQFAFDQERGEMWQLCRQGREGSFWPPLLALGLCFTVEGYTSSWSERPKRLLVVILHLQMMECWTTSISDPVYITLNDKIIDAKITDCLFRCKVENYEGVFKENFSLPESSKHVENSLLGPKRSLGELENYIETNSVPVFNFKKSDQWAALKLKEVYWKLLNKKQLIFKTLIAFLFVKDILVKATSRYQIRCRKIVAWNRLFQWNFFKMKGGSFTKQFPFQTFVFSRDFELLLTSFVAIAMFIFSSPATTRRGPMEAPWKSRC